MTESQIGLLLTDLWSDLRQPALLVGGRACAVPAGGPGLGLQKIASNYLSRFIILLDRSIRLAVRVQVGYRTDVAEAFRILLDVANKHPRVLKEPKSTAQVLQLAEFKARGVEIPYPQREVRLLGAAPDQN